MVVTATTVVVMVVARLAPVVTGESQRAQREQTRGSARHHDSSLLQHG
jgi:hypothetical protein